MARILVISTRKASPPTSRITLSDASENLYDIEPEALANFTTMRNGPNACEDFLAGRLCGYTPHTACYKRAEPLPLDFVTVSEGTVQRM